MSVSDWDWNSAHESMVIHQVQAIAVYTNPDGDIVIRQQDSMGNDDAIVIVPRGQVRALVKAVRDEAAKGLKG